VKRSGPSLLVALAAAATLAQPLTVDKGGAQSLTGASGLVTIPTAHVRRDADASVGVHLVAHRHHGYYVPDYQDRWGLVQFVSLGFLPSLEVDLRLTRPLGARNQGLGDRMASVRLRVLEEGRRRPALAVGAHDVVGTRLYSATYVVASKEVRLAAIPGTWSLSMGYGGNVLGLPIRGEQFVGLFGGISVQPREWMTLMAEYDGEQPNAGVRVGPVRGFAVLVAAQNMDALSGGVSYTFAVH
jgi:hypothetical protein